MTYLHLGCANRYVDGFINTDLRTEWKGKVYKLDQQLDISKSWPFEDNSVDGIVSMHVLHQLYWRDLVFALREAYRVLKVGGVMRSGVPLMESGKPVDFLLGWNNINLLDKPLFVWIFNQVGFNDIGWRNFGESSIESFGKFDNRRDHTFYLEVKK